MTELYATCTWSSGTLPPLSGQFCSDSRNWSGASQLVFSQTDSTGEDLEPVFSVMTGGDTIRASQATNYGNWRLWSVGAPPTQNADTTWTVPVSTLDHGGNQPSNSQPCEFVFTEADEPAGDVARWTMESDVAMHWYSVITCPHGTTRNGVWAVRVVQDDRNLLEFMEPTFANHQALHHECDCVLEQEWQPSFTPQPPTAVVETDADTGAISPASSGTITYSINATSVPTWYTSTFVCPHGATHPERWQSEASPPQASPLTPPGLARAVVNHQLLMGCTCTPAPISNLVSAQATLQPVSAVARDAVVALPQAAASPPSPFSTDNFGRLSVSAAGTLSITANITVSAGGGGIVALRLPDAATPDLTATSLLTAGFSAQGAAQLVWSGSVAANTSIEVDYYNGTGVLQDVWGTSVAATYQP